MEIELWKILPLIFLIAVLYSSVGHGGASGYLAIMSLLGISPVFMRSSSLILNLFVSGIAFLQFYKKGFFRWNLFYPFAISSIPFAFIGANIILNAFWYNRILGVLLVIAALHLSGVFKIKYNETEKKLSLTAGLITGAILGLLSGMIGIGGGIILSPIIILSGWGNIKETAAVSSLFIFVNSLAGIAGIGINRIDLPDNLYLWIMAAVIGGIAGSVWGSSIAKSPVLRNVLAFVILIAAIKLIFI